MTNRSAHLACFVVTLLALAPVAPAAAQRVVPVAVHAVHTEAPALEPLVPVSSAKPRSRPWWRYPVIGAVVVGVGGELLYLKQCSGNTDDGCMGGLGPLGFGAVVGATVGGVAELVHRSIEYARRPD